VLPPGARCIDRTIRELGLDAGETVITAIRRDGITGREPDPGTRLREGDVLVLWGTPEGLNLAESRLLMG
jgi:CPA2 family monovalent cation:H+ antiporter-2